MTLSRRARVLLAALVAVVAVGSVAIALRPEPSPPTTTTTTVPSTVPPTTPPTLSTTAPTTTGPAATDYDVVVVGDGLGGVSAAVTAARRGASVLLLSPTGYFGGQASAAGVSTMDEGGDRDLVRKGGLYRELLDSLEATYGSRTMGNCYFVDYTVCPEPDLVHRFFAGLLDREGVTVKPVTQVEDVLQEGTLVTGVAADGVAYRARVVIDATEFADLFPLVEGLDYEVGDPAGCVQDTTWTAVRNWYPDGAPEDLVPPQSAIDDLRAVYGDTEVNGWLAHFRNRVSPIIPGAWTPDHEARYRAMADRRSVTARDGAPEVTRTGANYANDSPMTVTGVEDERQRVTELRRALHVTYAFLWYLRWELGLAEWGVADDLGFDQARRMLWDDLVPDALERNLPPIPYVREARRLRAENVLLAGDVMDELRNRHRFPDSVMIGQYATDSHGCPFPADIFSGNGAYEVPLGAFIPRGVEGFLPGIVRNAGLDRVAASSLRTQPDEIWGGEVAGTLAALAVSGGVTPGEVPAESVQRALQTRGWTTRLP
jgi:hypothetical protein